VLPCVFLKAIINNNENVLTLGGQLQPLEELHEKVTLYLKTTFTGRRH